MKFFIFSIDDGTIYDKKVIDIFNKYHIKATFNLNSGLGNFVWYLDGKPIERFDLSKNPHLYDGHEVASHSLTHPHMTMCPNEEIVRQVGEDIVNLEKIFKRDVHTFAFPFHDADDRCINIIKHLHNIKIIRISDLDQSFKMPDRYHVRITSLNVDEAVNLVDDFIKDETAELFVFVSHAYDFEVNHTYDKLEELCQKVISQNDIKIITMGELEKEIR